MYHGIVTVGHRHPQTPRSQFIKPQDVFPTDLASRSLGAAGYVSKFVASLWNLTDASVAQRPRHMSNFRAIYICCHVNEIIQIPGLTLVKQQRLIFYISGPFYFLNFLLASTINLKLHLWVISLTLNCTKVNFMYMRIMSFIYMFTMWGPAPLLPLTNNLYMVASPMSPRLLWRPPTDATMSMSSYSLYCYSCML